MDRLGYLRCLCQVLFHALGKGSCPHPPLGIQAGQPACRFLAAQLELQRPSNYHMAVFREAELHRYLVWAVGLVAS